MARTPNSAPLRARRKRRAQEGNIIILLVLTLGIVMAMLAFSIDVPNMYRVQTELRAAVDSAALAGASGLDGTLSGFTVANQRATSYADRHYAYNANVSLAAQDIDLGNWDFHTNSFTSYSNAMQPSAVNAVKVTHRITQVVHPFGAVMGTTSSQVEVDAIAVGGGPYVPDCGFPLVVPDCTLDTSTTTGNCDYCMVMQDANTDTGAWTSFQNANGQAQIRDAVANACGDQSSGIQVDPTTNECAGTCGNNSAAAATEVPVNNGNLLNTSPNGICELIQAILTRNGAPEYFTVTAPVVETGMAPSNCGKAGLQSSMEVAGYTKLDIFGARCGNADAEVRATLPSSSFSPTCTPPSGKYILVSLHRDPSTGLCEDEPVGVAGGGGFYGTSARPRLVH